MTLMQYQNLTNKRFTFNEFKSPFFDDLKDSDELRSTYNKYPIIPFMGTNEVSADNVLNTLYRLAESTPVYQGVLKSIRMFVLNGGVEIVKQEGNQLFNRSYNEVSESELNNLDTQLSDVLIDSESIEEISEKALTGLCIDGNIGVLVRCSKLGGCQLKYVNQRNFRYDKDLNEKEKGVWIGSTFLHSSLIRTKPHFVSCYPFFSDNEGVYETFIHIKDESTGRKTYGLSSAASSIMSQYLLNQTLNYLSGETDNQFTGKVFFDAQTELAGDGSIPENGKELINSLRQTYKAKGKGETVMAHFRNENEDRTWVTQFTANTNEKFFDTVRRLSNEDILLAFGWDKRLVGLSRDNGLGGNDLEAIFAISSQKATTYQMLIEKAINQAFAAMIDNNYTFLKGYKLRFKNLYKTMIDTETNEFKLI